MNEKNCTKCNKIKPYIDFSKDIRKKDGLQAYCKACCSTVKAEFCKTKEGLIGRIYSNQKVHSLRRGDEMPSYSLPQLKIWALSQNKFHEIYEKWIISGYETMLSPSFDRINDYKPYNLDNLQIVTWKENKYRSYKDRKNGVNNKLSKSIIQMTESGDFLAAHHSICSAKRLTGVSTFGIVRCCNGKQNLSGGYRWMFAICSGKLTHGTN